MKLLAVRNAYTIYSFYTVLNFTGILSFVGWSQQIEMDDSDSPKLSTLNKFQNGQAQHC